MHWLTDVTGHRAGGEDLPADAFKHFGACGFHEPNKVYYSLACRHFRDHRFEQLVVIAHHDHIAMINHATQVAVHQVRQMWNLLVDVFTVSAVSSRVIHVTVENLQVVTFTDQHLRQFH